MMNNNYIYIILISILVILINVVEFLIIGKSKINNKTNKFRFLPLIFVGVFISVVIIAYNYYSSQYDESIKMYNNIQNKRAMINTLTDSLLTSNNNKDKLLDSLKSVNEKLSSIISEIKQQEKIIGSKPVQTDNIQKTIQETASEIKLIEEFNEIIPNSEAPKIKGYTSSGNTSNFIFTPPTDIYSGDYLTFNIKFVNEKLIDKISFIYLTVIEKKDKGLIKVFDQYYLPQKGINKFIIKNYFKGKEERYLEVGYFIKSDKQNEYPSYEKVTWYPY